MTSASMSAAGLAHPLDRYTIEPPEGSTIEPCDRHPEELRVYAEIPIRDLADGERPAVVRGWTCRLCFCGRSFRVLRGEEAA